MLSIKNSNDGKYVVIAHHISGKRYCTTMTKTEIVEHLKLPFRTAQLTLIGDLTDLYNYMKVVNHQFLRIEFRNAPYDYRILEYTYPDTVLIRKRLITNIFKSNTIKHLAKVNGVNLKCGNANPENIIILKNISKIISLSTHNINLGVFNLNLFEIRVTKINVIRVICKISRVNCKILRISLLDRISLKLLWNIISNIPDHVIEIIVKLNDHIPIAKVKLPERITCIN